MAGSALEKDLSMMKWNNTVKDGNRYGFQLGPQLMLCRLPQQKDHMSARHCPPSARPDHCLARSPSATIQLSSRTPGEHKEWLHPQGSVQNGSQWALHGTLSPCSTLLPAFPMFSLLHSPTRSLQLNLKISQNYRITEW